MTNIIKKSIKQINKLIELKLFIRNIYNEDNDNLDTKELTESKQLEFKIRNYKMWISKLNEILEDYGDIKFSEIKTLKLTNGLMKRLTEIHENGEINDINETNNKIYELVKKKNIRVKEKKRGDISNDSDDSDINKLFSDTKKKKITEKN